MSLTPRTPRSRCPFMDVCFDKPRLYSALNKWRKVTRCDKPQQVQAYLRHLALNSAYTLWLAATLRGNYVQDCVGHFLQKSALKRKQGALVAWQQCNEAMVNRSRSPLFGIPFECGQHERSQMVVPKRVPSKDSPTKTRQTATAFPSQRSPTDPRAKEMVALLEKARTKLALKLESAIRSAEEAETGRIEAESNAAKWKAEAERATHALFACTRKWSQKLKDQRQEATERSAKESSDLDVVQMQRDEELKALVEHASTLESENASLAKRVEALEMQMGLENRYGEILRASHDEGSHEGFFSAVGAASFFLASPLAPQHCQGEARWEGAGEGRRSEELPGELPFKVPSPASCLHVEDEEDGEDGEGVIPGSPEPPHLKLFPYLERKYAAAAAAAASTSLRQQLKDDNDDSEQEYYEDEEEEEEEEEAGLEHRYIDTCKCTLRTPTGILTWGKAATQRPGKRGFRTRAGAGGAACC